MARIDRSRIALALALAAGVALTVANRDALTAQALERWLAEAGLWAPMLFIAVYAAATVLFLPGSVLTLAGGALFGPVAGSLYSLTGATLGAAAAFLIARHLAADWVARRSGGRLRQIIEGVEAEGWRFVAFVRLVPLFPFNLVNYALGLTHIPLRAYVATSFVCMFPGALAYAWLGHAGRAALAGDEGAIRNGLLALALLAAVAFLPRLVKRLRGGSAEAGGSLTLAELRQRLDRQEQLLVLDVRAAQDYAKPGGHIPGAVNMPLAELPQRLGELEAWRDRPLAVICRTNRMSGQAVQVLREAGFRQALLVTDGMAGWEQYTNPAAAAPTACAAATVPTVASTGTGKTVTIIIQNAPYRGDNKAWHALRFAGAALAEDMKVRVHLLDDGAQLARRGHGVPPGAVDLEQLLTELMECGLEVRACGMALNDCKLDEGDLISGVQPGSMKALAGWVRESDLVLTF